MTEREKMHACVLYNPNDETIMAERSESPSLSVKRFFFLSPAGSCGRPHYPKDPGQYRVVFSYSPSLRHRGAPPVARLCRKHSANVRSAFSALPTQF